MKKIILSIFAILLIAVALLFAINGKNNYDPSKYAVTATNGINVGSTLSIKLPDQFDKAHELTDATKKIVFVFEKATGHTVKEFLKTQKSDYLSYKNGLFVADISPMPTVIRNTFALPDLKKSNFSVLLIYDKNISKTLKNEKEADKIALIELNNKKVVNVHYIKTVDELKKLLDK